MRTSRSAELQRASEWRGLTWTRRQSRAACRPCRAALASAGCRGRPSIKGRRRAGRSARGSLPWSAGTPPRRPCILPADPAPARRRTRPAAAAADSSGSGGRRWLTRTAAADSTAADSDGGGGARRGELVRSPPQRRRRRPRSTGVGLSGGSPSVARRRRIEGRLQARPGHQRSGPAKVYKYGLAVELSGFLEHTVIVWSTEQMLYACEARTRAPSTTAPGGSTSESPPTGS